MSISLAQRRRQRALAAKIVNVSPLDAKEPVTLIDYDAQAEEKIIAAILYSHARQSLMQLREIAVKMSAEERRKILEGALQQTPPPPRQAQPRVRERLLHLRHPR